MISLGSLDGGEIAAAGAASSPPTAETHARLAQLVQEHFTFIWRLLRRLGLSKDLADDAAQQVFLVAVERIDEIVGGKERSFLFGTALRVASTRRRQRAREQPDDGHDPEDPTPGADELTGQKQLRELFDGILSRMDEDLRVIFVLVEVEGLTAPEAGQLLGIPVGTATSRLRRARELFEAGVKRVEAQRTFRGGRS